MFFKIVRKVHLLNIILLVSILFQSFTYCERTSKQSNKLVFTYVSYEYGKPLQKTQDGFGIRRIYEVYDNKELKVIDRLYQGYEITTSIKIDNRLFKKLSKLKNIISFRNKIALDKGVYYAGAYDYISVVTENGNEELCFITPLVSDELIKLITSLYSVKLDTGTQTQSDKQPNEVDFYKERIIPVHKESYLPVITLPPPPIKSSEN